MKKKTIDPNFPSFIQAINITKDWCKEWEDELLSDEVFADRISELLQTKNGIRGFFAYSLSDEECTLLDKLPTALIFKFRELGKIIIEITLKNLIMSSAQIINHQRDNNEIYEIKSFNITERCKNILRLLDTNLVTKSVTKIIAELDEMGNSYDKSKKYDQEQKEFIREKINEIAQ